MNIQSFPKEIFQNNFKNTKKQGDAGLGIAIGWFTMKGYTVSIPLTDSQDYDLVVEINKVLRKIQVKTTFFKIRSSYQVNLSIKGGNRSGIGKLKMFDPNSCDYIFIVTGQGLNYLIPITQIKARYQLILNSNFDNCII